MSSPADQESTLEDIRAQAKIGKAFAGGFASAGTFLRASNLHS